MASYRDLVSKVLSNETLVKAANNLVDDNCLNLVAEDWLSRLQNNIAYQNYSYQSEKLWKLSFSTDHCYCEESKNPDFYVVLVATCTIQKPYKNKSSQSNNRNANLIVVDSEPLNKIARVMTSDLGPDVNISNDFKFSFEMCSLIECKNCSEFAKKFRKAGYDINRITQPCISDTQIFDGEHVVNRFYSQIENIYTDTFLAVLRLKINVRYLLKEDNVYRISGNILDFIGFRENKLRPTKKVNLGSLIEFEDKTETLSVRHNKFKNKPLCLETKTNDCTSLDTEFENLFGSEKILCIEGSNSNRKRKEVSPDREEEVEREVKKQNLIDNTDECDYERELESFIF